MKPASHTVCNLSVKSISDQAVYSMSMDIILKSYQAVRDEGINKAPAILSTGSVSSNGRLMPSCV